MEIITKTQAESELAKRELARRHLLDFIKYNYPNYKTNWHLELLASKLEEVENGTLKRLMVFMPPRHGKSEMCSIQFPTWAMGRNKDRNIIQASYSGDLALDFGRQTRNLIASQEFRNVFSGVNLSDDSQSKGKWNTNGRGAYNAVGVGGAITGKGADIFIIDDPIKNRQDADSVVYREMVWGWWRSTARTRLSPNGAVVLILTRWHENDLAGRILAEDSEGWCVLSLPAVAENDEEHRKLGEALWPGHYDLENLERIRKDIGPYEWSALYQQRPVNEASQEFKKSWFKYRTKDYLDAVQTNRFLTVDTAISQRDSSDNTGMVINYVNSENQWHLSAYKLRINSAELIETLFSLHQTHRFNKIGIEETVYLQAIKPFLDVEQRRRNVFLPIVGLKHNQTAKETRIRSLIPRYESGSVFHIEKECQDLEAEMSVFPKGAHDDVLDSCAYQSQIAIAPMFSEYTEEQFTPPSYL